MRRPRWLDPVELLGLGSLAIMGVGLWLVHPAAALIVLGAIGFAVMALAIRNRSRPKRER